MEGTGIKAVLAKKKSLFFAVAVLIVIIIFAYGRSQYRAKLERQLRNESKGNLGSIFTSQVTYYGEEGTYASSIENLGWAPEGKTEYSYCIVEATATQFVACAEGNIDRDSTLDVWEIDEKRELRHVVNDLTQ